LCCKDFAGVIAKFCNEKDLSSYQLKLKCRRRKLGMDAYASRTMFYIILF
jgi:hypothetical protein